MKKIPLWKNAILIVSMLVIVVVAAFAWFYTSPRASADAIKLKVGRASYIQVADPDGDNWSNDLELSLEGIGKTLREVSGNGTDFFVPDYEWDYDQNGNWTQQFTLTNLSDLSENEQGEYYYEKVLRFRSDGAQDVYLTPESYVLAPGNSHIDAAVRLAFFELNDDGTETLRFIWAPNSTVRYVDGAFVEDGEVESQYSYQKSTRLGDTVQVATNGEVCGYRQNFLWSNAVELEDQDVPGQNFPPNAPSVFTWGEPNEEGIYEKSMKVMVWIEGTDSECVKEIIGEKFTIKLQFTIAPEENDNE